VYDGLVFVPVMHFGDYPIERPMLGLMLANPVDRARVLQLLQFDLSALLGYSGAVFQQLFSDHAASRSPPPRSALCRRAHRAGPAGIRTARLLSDLPSTSFDRGPVTMRRNDAVIC